MYDRYLPVAGVEESQDELLGVGPGGMAFPRTWPRPTEATCTRAVAAVIAPRTTHQR
jgi:hypothetical protein